MAASNSARYDEAGMVKPKNSRTASTGSVVDPRSGKHPSTHKHASESLGDKVAAGAAARRPGGAFRGAKHGFHPPRCTCGKHPCTCGSIKGDKIHDNVNVC